MAPADNPFLDFLRLVVSGAPADVSRRLKITPAWAVIPSPDGARRGGSPEFFLQEIGHYVYRGDTALHLAAAAFRRPTAELLVSHGASCRARNRRGAEPLHYAADGNHADPRAQADTIAYLVSAGATPNAVDASGVAPLHRAVRTRSLAAVRALLDAGADPRQRNKSGSTPLHLAVQSTGKSHSGSERAREQQAGIIRLLIECGARAADRDGNGTRVRDAARSEWIRTLVEAAG